MGAKSPPSPRGLSGGPLGSSGLDRRHVEGSEGFWAPPGPWELSRQVQPRPSPHEPLHGVLTALRSGPSALHHHTEPTRASRPS